MAVGALGRGNLDIWPMAPGTVHLFCVEEVGHLASVYLLGPAVTVIAGLPVVRLPMNACNALRLMAVLAYYNRALQLSWFHDVWRAQVALGARSGSPMYLK